MDFSAKIRKVTEICESDQNVEFRLKMRKKIKWQIRLDIFKKVRKSDFSSSIVTMKFGMSGFPIPEFVPIVTGLKLSQVADFRW